MAMNNKYAEFVTTKLNTRELLEQLAEEAAELGKSSLKLIRAAGISNNVTPHQYYVVESSLLEEMQDVMSVFMLLYPDKFREMADGIELYWKYERWAKRLGYKEKEMEDEL